tara:strand:+ start:1037 stop:1312 length:276 start_codon:yes stop_codon:yes gene_type:complete
VSHGVLHQGGGHAADPGIEDHQIDVLRTDGLSGMTSIDNFHDGWVGLKNLVVSVLAVELQGSTQDQRGIHHWMVTPMQKNTNKNFVSSTLS